MTGDAARLTRAEIQCVLAAIKKKSADRQKESATCDTLPWLEALVGQVVEREVQKFRRKLGTGNSGRRVAAAVEEHTQDVWAFLFAPNGQRCLERAKGAENEKGYLRTALGRRVRSRIKKSLGLGRDQKARRECPVHFDSVLLESELDKPHHTERPGAAAGSQVELDILLGELEDGELDQLLRVYAADPELTAVQFCRDAGWTRGRFDAARARARAFLRANYPDEVAWITAMTRRTNYPDEVARITAPVLRGMRDVYDGDRRDDPDCSVLFEPPGGDWVVWGPAAEALAAALNRTPGFGPWLVIDTDREAEFEALEGYVTDREQAGAHCPPFWYYRDFDVPSAA